MVQVRTNDQVTTLTLDRPASLNALTPAAAMELADEFENAIANDARAIVLTGEGEAFCAGGDLEAMQTRDESPSESFDRLQETVNRLVTSFLSAPCPVVAKVNGDAIGGGTNLAAACDIVYAVESARFGVVFVNVGLIPDIGGSYLLPRILGLRTAMELALTGRLFDAEEAASYGLVSRVVPDDELSTAVDDLVGELATRPTDTQGLTKRAIYGNLGRGLDDALEREAAIQSMAYNTESHREGVAAILEDRDPDFE